MRKVVFIMGHGHCGSTLISLILSTNGQAFGIGELQAVGSRIKQREFSIESACGICDGECSVWKHIGEGLGKYFPSNKIMAYSERVMPSLVGNIYQHIFNHINEHIIIDNSKTHYWISRQLSNKRTWVGVRPCILYVMRDGRAVVNSYLRKYPDRSPIEEIVRWRENTRNMNSLFLGYKGEKNLIKYEDFTTTPEVQIKSLCKWLGINYESSMMDFHLGNHHLLYSNRRTRNAVIQGKRVEIKKDDRWLSELDSVVLHQFDRIAGDMNQLVGYRHI